MWLALPVELALLRPVLLAISAVPGRRCSPGCSVLALSGVLAWLARAPPRGHRTLSRGASRGPRSRRRCPSSARSAATSWPTALHRLDRALAEQRERRAETDRLLATLLDALPDPLLLVGRGRTVVGANQAATRCSATSRSTGRSRRSLRDPGAARGGRRGARGPRRGPAHAPAARAAARARSASRSCRSGCAARPAALIGLRELTEQLMIERMRSDFVANASHELRTPLTALRGFIDTLAGPARDDPEARERFLKTMAGEAARMSRLVDDLLSLSRIEQTEHQPPSERVDLVDCLEERGAQPCGATPHERTPRSSLRQVRAAAGGARRSRPAGPAAHQPDRQRDQVRRRARGGVEIALPSTSPRRRRAPGRSTGRPAVRIVVADRGPGIAQRASAAGDRALLSRRPGPLAPARRHRPRARDRQAHPAPPPRPPGDRERARPRHHRDGLSAGRPTPRN